MAPSKRLVFAHYNFGAGLVYLARGRACSARPCRCQKIYVDDLLERQDLLGRMTSRDIRRAERFAELRQQVRRRVARALFPTATDTALQAFIATATARTPRRRG